MLQQKPEFEIIGELSDGLAAVQKAEELHPDLIVLDIGLPTLSGIEAARQIRKLVPNAKILFLTQESSDDVVQKAFNLGARGYVVKAWAGSELLPAVEAVLQDKKFVSGGVTRGSFIDARNAQSADVPNEALASIAHKKPEITRKHEVLFYSSEASLLESFTAFITAALMAGNVVIVITSESHRASLRQTLEAQGLDIAAATKQRRYIPLDVSETLSGFMVDDLPDEIRFAKVAGDLIRAAAKAVNGDHRRVSACGECAPALWAGRFAEAAIRVEQLWDEVARTYGIDILCGYSTGSFRGDEDRQIFERIRTEHSAVHSSEETA